ncbi:glycoside hydrolase family 73 protein [Massilia sp. YIM B02443]|uniref:glycoside hydrolase family 73 protein n=1 Tax=Massilia sp. YIM B02443 TaxID=3050127 RepID=UPI0025B70E1E|nr:glucosaminidase domain-containing protein [Massilia sp. YIM B02443]MDN4035982.1 glucosaminidase domain-containing protein [Massilia sp. YIM B02443]
MRHVDLSMPSIAPTAATSATSATRPTAAIGGGEGFGRTFSELQSEVMQFIESGDSAASSLNAESAMLRARISGLLGSEPVGLEGKLASGTGANSPAQQAFLDRIAPWAQKAAARLGVAPELVSAHAALESGWGQRPLRAGDGAATHNLFGIKAGAGWDGATSDSATTEYVNGAALKTRERFRAYPDAASAFDDYARMLLENPRYRGALNTGSDAHAFAQGLARGGYATDPAYAAKLAKVAASLQGGAE